MLHQVSITTISATTYLFVGFDESCHDLVVNVLVDDEAAETGAALAGGSHGGEEDGRHHHVQIAVRHHD